MYFHLPACILSVILRTPTDGSSLLNFIVFILVWKNVLFSSRQAALLPSTSPPSTVDLSLNRNDLMVYSKMDPGTSGIYKIHRPVCTPRTRE